MHASIVRGSVPLSNRCRNMWSEAKGAMDRVNSRLRFHDLWHAGLTIFAQQGVTVGRADETGRPFGREGRAVSGSDPPHERLPALRTNGRRCDKRRVDSLG